MQQDIECAAPQFRDARAVRKRRKRDAAKAKRAAAPKAQLPATKQPDATVALAKAILATLD